MKAVIPINITALRVSANDATNIVGNFKGRMANFNNLPYIKDTKRSSTGDAVLQPLESNNSPLATLREGIHLHWELSDCFRKGTQEADGKIIFPQAPNRWLITRYLCKYDVENNQWLPPTPHSWMVESDYIAETLQEDKDGTPRISVPVPLPSNAASDQQPYRYMGRVVDGADWPLRGANDKYLKDFTDTEGNPCYLTAIGFLGPAFSAYYPDCCSVFGFHDRFIDDPNIYDAVRNAKPIQFKASYHVVGWIDGDEIADRTLCNGIIQEIVWDMLSYPGTRNFLGNPTGNISHSIWEDNNIRLSIGNTLKEALAALLSPDISVDQKDKELENNYEYLLNMLLSGRIEEIEKGSNLLSKLEKGLHSDGFASEQGGLKWVIQKKEQTGGVQDPTKESHLPLSLHHSLEALNEAQKEYETFRGNLETERKQFFMDWYKYIKMYVEDSQNYNVTLTNISNFVENSFDYIIDHGEEVGILSYAGSQDNGIINSVQQPQRGPHSKTCTVWEKFEECRKETSAYPEWQLLAIPAPTYRLPTDLVTAIEVDSLRCKTRNGDIDNLPVRTITAVLNKLIFTYKTFTGTIEPEDIPVLPIIEQKFSGSPDIQKLCAEVRLIIPSFATEIATILQKKGGQDNPAVENETTFILNFTALLGGGSSVSAAEYNNGLFNTIREENYQPVANPTQQTSGSPQLTVTFTNTKGEGWLTHPLGWNTQEHFADLNEKRHDPFFPLVIIWKAKLDPIKCNGGNQNYREDSITEYFTFNTEATDYTYTTNKPFVDAESVKYTGSNILIKNAIHNLTSQIQKYAEKPDNGIDSEIASKIKEFKERKIISQTLSGFSANTLLRTPIPPMLLTNLTRKMDNLTNQYILRGLTQSAGQGDNWYANGFNNQAAISVGSSAQRGFYPLRSGFLAVESLEIVDVFGQRMQLSTPTRNADGSLQLLSSTFLSSISDDKKSTGKAYLPPRLLVPSRLLFKWLDAQEDFTTPACGWVLPNHLDHSLFFYNGDGSAIGSFGIEHHTVKYRTQAGNRKNPSDSLETDIGTPEESIPTVNRWLAHFMHYINDMSKDGERFLADLMQVILDSENFISPEKNPGDNSLSVLIGRPLALARVALGMETYGASLPLNQSAMSTTDPWVEDVNNRCFDYAERMQHGDAGLSKVQIPVRLGDHLNMDDGLIGYLRETGDDKNPYATDFFAPAAIKTEHGVVHPSDTNLLLNLNAKQQTFTMLVDPRARVHALTGLLPMESLEFPSDYFTEAAGKLEMTFPTYPLLQQSLKFTIPLSDQTGYTWSWVTQHQGKDIPLSPPYSQEDISWGYSPQTIEEGWLKLSKEKE
jgi:hypothetical protein